MRSWRYGTVQAGMIAAFSQVELLIPAALRRRLRSSCNARGCLPRSRTRKGAVFQARISPGKCNHGFSGRSIRVTAFLRSRLP